MKYSMQTKLILIMALMLFALTTSIGAANIFFLPHYYQMTKVSKMENAYHSVLSEVKNVDWESITDEEQGELYDEIDRLASDYNVSVYLMKISAYQSSGDIATIDYVYPSNSERLQQVTKDQLGKYVKNMFFGTSLGDDCEALSQTKLYDVYKVYDRRLESNFLELTGKMPQNYWIYLRTNYQEIQESTQVANAFMIRVGLALMLFGMLIMFFVSKQYTKPILKLAKHAREMEKLNFSSRFDEEREDEIGVLAKSMNSLSDKLEDTITQLKNANNELQLDIERKTEQEEMRREFLGNVSHELKTPIALIQGYAEGLLENLNDDPESREFYCEVIMDEAKKMNKMVKNLLSLNELEFGNSQINFEHFDLRDVIDSVLQSSEILFQQKDVTLSYHKSKEPLLVWGDEYMIEEVLTNYVSNAFNHVKGEKKIEIKVTQNDEVAR
ncbi:MAG: HAMP domain-containing protein, partial [Eubacterium sp.]|nr:HAMP domain-containing protein [Eubacterium sp.]